MDVKTLFGWGRSVRKPVPLKIVPCTPQGTPTGNSYRFSALLTHKHPPRHAKAGNPKTKPHKTKPHRGVKCEGPRYPRTQSIPPQVNRHSTPPPSPTTAPPRESLALPIKSPVNGPLTSPPRTPKRPEKEERRRQLFISQILMILLAIRKLILMILMILLAY